MGRKRKPPQLHELHSNPGHRKQPSRATFKGKTTLPGWLDPVARQEWNRLKPCLERLEMLTPETRGAVAALVNAYSGLVRSMVAFNNDRPEQMCLFTGTGGVKTRPELDTALKFSAEYRRWMIEFGLTPSSMGNIPVPGDDDEEKAKALRDFLFSEELPDEGAEDENVVSFSKR